jgi:hypothetical protein
MFALTCQQHEEEGGVGEPYVRGTNKCCNTCHDRLQSRTRPGADTWRALLIFELLGSVIWLGFTLNDVFRSVSVEDVIVDVKAQSPGELHTSSVAKSEPHSEPERAMVEPKVGVRSGPDNPPEAGVIKPRDKVVYRLFGEGVVLKITEEGGSTTL